MAEKRKNDEEEDATDPQINKSLRRDEQDDDDSTTTSSSEEEEDSRGPYDEDGDPQCTCDKDPDGNDEDEVICRACLCNCRHMMLKPHPKFNPFGNCWSCCEYYLTEMDMQCIWLSGWPLFSVPRQLKPEYVEKCRRLRRYAGH